MALIIMNTLSSDASIENLHIADFLAMPTPQQLHQQIPLTETAAGTVMAGRESLNRILRGEDRRRFVVVGPCSIHDPVAGLDYARRLKALADEVSDVLLIVMRVYFEKPRTTVGWKGYINDPHMDDSFRIDEGMLLGRKFLLEVNELGLPAASEALDPISPQYLGDLIAWNAIGARTTESQTHRAFSTTHIHLMQGTKVSISNNSGKTTIIRLKYGEFLSITVLTPNSADQNLITDAIIKELAS